MQGQEWFLGESCALAPSFGLLQHPDQHRPQRPVLLAVDQEVAEARATLKARAHRRRSRPTPCTGPACLKLGTPTRGARNVAVTEVGEWTAHVEGTAMIDEKWRSQ
jgi:hypothetical protein